MYRQVDSTIYCDYSLKKITMTSSCFEKILSIFTHIQNNLAEKF